MPARSRGVLSSKLPDVDLMVLRVAPFLRLGAGSFSICCSSSALRAASVSCLISGVRIPF